MKSSILSAALLGALLLPACAATEKTQDHERSEALARRYMARCVQAIERRRVQPGPRQGLLPVTLDGQTCQSPVLEDYALSERDDALVKTSVIRLDPSRLSEYTINITTLDGETITYVDRGKAAAAAEQAGTFGDSSRGGALAAGPDGTEGDLNQAELPEAQER
ncbi:hypothetical protein [Deinococcus navajonensis]|uniref:Lipoprotein n=1 Tax=Deinococcus navajonensis TaxID=309884 RepID=A0ABV8XLD5_9DEIO